MPEQYRLVYFPIRGLAEPIRMFLHDHNIEFKDEKVEGEAWAQLKPTMQFGQMPCLYEGDQQIVQSGTILRHLARKHGAYGSNENDMTFCDMVSDGVTDLRRAYATLIYVEYDMPGKKEEFISKTLPAELEKFEKLMKDKTGGKDFILGSKTCYADYTLFEILDAILILAPHCLDHFPTLKGYHDRMAARPNLQNYLHSEAWKTMKLNGNGKQ